MSVATFTPEESFLDDLERRLHRPSDQWAARATIRCQIARLESELGVLAVDRWMSGDRQPPSHHRDDSAGVRTARLLSLGELELVRDELVERVHRRREDLKRRSQSQAYARRRLGAMLDDPASHQFEIVPLTELGEQACGAYHVLPRLGLLGMLFGWWCVKLSSGCPLAMYHRSTFQRHEHLMYRRQARLELVVAIIVAIAILAAVAIFLLVYHDFPFRFGEPG